MKPNTILHCNRTLLTFLSGLGFVSLVSLHAQTYTWDQQALGQLYLTCPNLHGPDYPNSNYYYPSNSYWSQSVTMGPDCDPNDGNQAMVIQPSNWLPNPPVGVYPGGPGAVGVDVVLGAPANTVLDANVTVNHLTLQTSGSLSILGFLTCLTANTVDIQGDTIIVAAPSNNSMGGCINIPPGGTFTKSGGTGTFGFFTNGLGSGLQFYMLNANLVVKSGTFEMPYRAGGQLFGDTFYVSNNATLLLTKDSATQLSLADTITGVGDGTVVMNTGSVVTFGPDFYGQWHYNLTLNFPDKMFQWSGGKFWGGSVTNIGVLNLTNSPVLQAYMCNQGIVNLADNSTLALEGGGSHLNNQAGSRFDIQGDSSITENGVNTIWNYGLFKKSAGTGRSLINPYFQNYGATVEVDSGTLVLNGASGGYFTNTSFIVGSGATLAFSISNNATEIEGTLTGSGGGTVLVNDGMVYSESPTTLNFPGAMFQWAGGSLGNAGSPLLTNAGTINISGTAGVRGYLGNNGIMIQSGAGGIVSGYSFHDTLDNYAGGIYDIQNDNGVSLSAFNNYGLLEKTGGSGTSVIQAIFHNYGLVQVTTGAVLFGGGAFNQDAGTLQLTPAISFDPSQTFNLNGGTVTGSGTLGSSTVYVNGGVLAPGNPYGVLSASNNLTMYGGAISVVLGGPSQFSHLAVSNTVYLSDGVLNVNLANGYVPTIGTQFPIVSSAYLLGHFTKLNVPQGISVNYSNNGVYLLVVGPVAAQLQSPQVSGDNFTFSFGTTNGLGYTVLQNTDLATTNWTFYTNLIGNGSLYQFTTPVTNIPRRFFRVSQP